MSDDSVIKREGPYNKNRTPESQKLDNPLANRTSYTQIPQDIYNNARTYAQWAVAEIRGFTTDLLRIGTTTFNIPLPAPLTATIDIQSAKDALNTIGPAPEMEDIPPVTDIVPPDVPTVGEVVAPTLPSVPSFTYDPDDIDPDALFNAARDRETIKLNALLEDTKREYAATGFVLPQGALVKQQDKMRYQYQQVLSDFNRDIPLKQLEVWKLRADIYKTELEGVNAQIAAEVALFEAKVKTALSNIELYNAEIKAYAARLDLIKTQSEIIIDEYKARMQGYGVQNEAIIAAFKLEAEILDKEWAATIAQLNANIELAKLNLAQIVEATKLRQAAAGAGADVFKNLAAAALAASHVTASIQTSETFSTGFSTQNQMSFNYGVSDQDSETIRGDVNAG